MTRKKKSRKAGPLGIRKEDRPNRPSRNLEQVFAKKLKGNKPGTRNNPDETKITSTHSTQETKDKRHGSKKPIALDAAPVQTPQEPVFNRDMQPTAKIIKEKPVITPEQELAALESDERFLTLIERVDEGNELESKDAKFFNKCVKRHQELTKILGIDDEEPSDDDLLEQFESDSWKDDFIDD